MHKERHGTEEIIQIVLNHENKIQYSSINNGEAYNYLKKLHIFDRLSESSYVQFSYGKRWVTINKIIIANQKYYVITIDSNNYKCSKLLTDSVTGLYNRNYWQQINDGSIYHHLYSKKDFSLIFIDIDNLKEINDTFGHLVGDKAIEIVGQAIKNSIRKEDLGIRYGGDEFIILLFNQHKKAAKRVTERVRREIRKLAVEQGMNIQISAGIACTDCLVDLEDMIKMADKNLYREKEKKKEQKGQNNEVNNLAKEIREIRDELNRKIDGKSKIFTSTEILELSQKLDKLIVNYLGKK
ncbi:MULTISPECIES: diguanylate cyclase [Eubacteriales]|uniref:diguanylate cyclase n=1 Tax=Eubacteriales TaxID=186802 RepID=UPI001F008D6E|nr:MULTISPECIES: diguanylate cyclase [Eubacteriales]MCF6466617.1 GGDEF domain-containing protein [Clostridium sp. Cult2]WIV12814.1 diguanylate cyclase [Proteiniborus sp. MB09-C3]